MGRRRETDEDEEEMAAETPCEMIEMGEFWRSIVGIWVKSSKPQLWLQKQDMLEQVGRGTWWERREDDGGSGGGSGDGGSWPMAAEKIPC